MAATWNRINTLILLLVLFALVSLIGMLAAGVSGGPLDPPGAPGSTDGVRRPGTPISSLPFSITQPGYYYVTRNLTGPAGTDGVIISSDNVTLDLGGFTLFGTSKTADGVRVAGTRVGIRVHNGSLEGWNTALRMSSAHYSRVDNVRVTRNIIGMTIGTVSQISDCNASFSDLYGILATESEVHHCIIANNGTSGIDLVHKNFFHHNHVFFNNITLNVDAAGVHVSGSDNVIADNNLGEQANGFSLLLGVASLDNLAVRNSLCGYSNTGVGNFIPLASDSPERNLLNIC